MPTNLDKGRSKCRVCDRVRYREHMTPAKVSIEAINDHIRLEWVCLDECAAVYAKERVIHHQKEMAYYVKFGKNPELNQKIYEQYRKKNEESF